MNSHVRIAVLAIPATGHVNPTLDLASELVRRGRLAPQEFVASVAATIARHADYAASLAQAMRGPREPSLPLG